MGGQGDPWPVMAACTQLCCKGVSSPSWVEIVLCHLPSTRGQAHAWPRTKFSTMGSSLASRELASHHLSDGRAGHLPSLERCGPFLWHPPSSLRSGRGIQPWRSLVQSELPNIHSLLCAGGGTGCFRPYCLPYVVLTTTLQRGGVLPISETRKLRPRESDCFAQGHTAGKWPGQDSNIVLCCRGLSRTFSPAALWAVPEALIVFLGLYPLSSGAGAPDLLSLTAQEVKNL